MIVADQPQEVAERLAQLSSVAGYPLEVSGDQRIHDRYFDTSDRSLAARRIALRVRQVNGSTLIAVKGPSRAMPWGTNERFELEEGWSARALNDVLRKLRENVVSVPDSASIDRHSPDATLENLGFLVVQDRETERRIRHVMSDDEVAAELAIDGVTFHLGEMDGRLYEVEVEAKRPGVAQVLKRVIDALRDMPGLQPWPYSKLATGNGLARLVSDGRRQDVLDDRDIVTARGMELIAGVLSEGTL
jgi:inorganic triphosphatase YgiF